MPRDENPLVYTGPKFLDFRKKIPEAEPSQQSKLKSLMDASSSQLQDEDDDPIKRQAKLELSERDNRRRFFKQVYHRLDAASKEKKLSEQEQEIARIAAEQLLSIDDDIEADALRGREAQLREK